jgi:hypothetical protein
MLCGKRGNGCVETLHSIFMMVYGLFPFHAHAAIPTQPLPITQPERSTLHEHSTSFFIFLMIMD